MGNIFLIGGSIMLFAIVLAIAVVVTRKALFPAEWDYEDNEIVRERRERIFNR